MEVPAQKSRIIEYNAAAAPYWPANAGYGPMAAGYQLVAGLRPGSAYPPGGGDSLGPSRALPAHRHTTMITGQYSPSTGLPLPGVEAEAPPVWFCNSHVRVPDSRVWARSFLRAGRRFWCTSPAVAS